MANRFGSFLYIRDAFPSWSFDMILANGLEALASAEDRVPVVLTPDEERIRQLKQAIIDQRLPAE